MHALDGWSFKWAGYQASLAFEESGYSIDLLHWLMVKLYCLQVCKGRAERNKILNYPSHHSKSDFWASTPTV